MYSMSQGHYSTLMANLSAIADPRSGRGRRYEWYYLLTLVAAATLAGQKGLTEIAYWVWKHREELISSLQPRRRQVPSYATLRRLLEDLEIDELEAQAAAFGQRLDADETEQGRIATQQGGVLQVQAVDGKTLCGASAYGTTTHLVSLVRHGSGSVLGQQRVASKIDERKAAHALLIPELLSGSVTTCDALHTQVKLAKQIVAAGRHYLMVVKENQPMLYDNIAEAFALLPSSNRLDAEYGSYQSYQDVQRGHGRLAQRTLESIIIPDHYLRFPNVTQVLRRTYWCQQRRTGAILQKVHLGITSLTRKQVTLAQLEQLWRGHWTIENVTHYIRDVSLGEDACKVHSGSAPQALAALRNAIVSLVRHEGWAYVPNASRHFEHHLQHALRLIGALAT
jgi:predicted transposase YbfD/YdcC